MLWKFVGLIVFLAILAVGFWLMERDKTENTCKNG